MSVVEGNVMGRPVADNLFRGEGRSARLLAGRNKADGRLRFPFPNGADAEEYDLIELSPEGTLWSWTVQRFRPKSPFNGRGDPDGPFAPYAVGYIEIPGEIIVESRIVADDYATLRIGQPMAITTEAYREDEKGEPVLTYAFTPIAEQRA
jgi:uncharacterized protein